ncbi:MAG TPA: NAD(P)-dependent oxidoreductase [Candidatus Cybelea sp.]|nr:NAD(P)-dependent oxidoreductase [Candidatus Cybelea sp.]
MRKAFFPVSLNLDGKRCVVIGPDDDREAIEKSAALRESGAQVQRIYDPQRLQDGELEGVFFVISTPQDAALSARLRALAERYRFLLCCIDQPKFGFVAMAAIAKAGPVRIAISTAGLAPRVGKAIKRALQRAMDEKFTRFIDHLAERRANVQAARPEPESSALRRAAMIEAARGFNADVTFSYPPWFEDAER